jgi:multidrug efflux pump
MGISELAVRRPVLAIVISLLLIVFGLISFDRLSVREYPDIDRPVVSVSTRYVGASSAVIETKVTQVIEDSIAGVEGVLKIESESQDERSSVRVEFDVARDLDGAANDVRDRVSRVLGALPEEADPPEIIKADANAEPVMMLSFSSATMSSLQLTDYAERNLIDRLSTVPGVARVSVFGGRRYAMRIWLDRQALAARGLTVTDVESALRRENVELPAGRLESRTREFSLRTLVGLDSEQDFRELAVARGADGHLVRLGEVATVQLAAENERSYNRDNGQPGVTLAVEAQSKANTLEIARGVRAELERIGPSLPPASRLQIGMDNAIAIEAALREVVIAIVLALLSVLAVIYAFLGNFRATLIPALTIPVSIIAAGAVMYVLGYSINVLTLLGLVLAIGLVVDDAIVVLENVHRRTEDGTPPMVAAIVGSREIAFAVIATTLTLAAVFVPIAFLPGDLGRLFREFGFTLAAAVLISALIALTLTPMLASRLPPDNGERTGVARVVDRFFRALAVRYEAVLRSLIARPLPVLAVVVSLVAVAVVTFRALPEEFAPTADVGRVFISMEGPEGASLEYMDGYARQLEAIVLEEMKQGDIERVSIRVPGGFGGRSGDVNSARAMLVLTDWNARDRSADEIARAVVAKARSLPGVRVKCGQARQPRPARLRSPGAGGDRRARVSAAVAVDDEARRPRARQSGVHQRRLGLQGAQAADPHRDRSRPRRRARHLPAGRGPHARDGAGLAHRHHLGRSRARVQRGAAGER